MAMLTRESWIKVLLIALLCIVLCCGIAGWGIGCSSAVGQFVNTATGWAMPAYSNTGDIEVSANEVRGIEIIWLAGHVEVAVSDDDLFDSKVTGIEDSGGTRRSMHMTWQVDNSVLHIGFCAPQTGFSGCSGMDSKKLVLTLPKSVAKSLDSFDLSAASGSYNLGAISCKSMNIDLASGHLEGSGLEVDGVNLDVASGNVRLNGKFQDAANLSMASGIVELDFLETMPNQTDLDIMSGQLTISVPEDSGFKAYVDRVSGSFDCELPGSWDAQDDGLLTCGDGSNNMNLSMASGNVVIRPL